VTRGKRYRTIGTEAAWIAAACLWLSGPARAAITTLDLSILTPTQLVNTFLGSGIFVSNVTYQGATWAAGAFGGGGPSILFDSGIVLSTGNVVSVTGPNVNNEISANSGMPGYAPLGSLAGAATYDAAVLEFDFVPTSSMVVFDYVFASDEYNEYVGAWNDVFAFFLDGVNVATVPGTSQPVSINNVNLGNNSVYFRNNDVQTYGPGMTPYDTEMDGLTVVFTVSATLTPYTTHHIVLAIADTGDGNVDSDVFLRAASFRTPVPQLLLAKQGPATAVVGGLCVFSLTVSITGTGVLDNVTVWDSLPAGTSLVSVSAGGALSGSVLTWSLGTVSAGTTASLSFTVRLGGSLASVANSALGSSDSGGTPAPRVASNTVMVAVLRGVTALDLEAAPAGPLCAGYDLNYTLGWRNTGAGTLFGVTITDTVPAGTAWASLAGTWAKPDWLGTPTVGGPAWASDASGPWTEGVPPVGTAPAVLRWVVDRVAPGASGFVRFRVSVSPSPPPGGYISNTASATQMWDAAVAESCEVTTSLGSALTAVAWAGPPIVNVGQTFLVTLTVDNAGCSTASAPSLWGPVATGTGAAAVSAGPYPAVPGSIPAGGSLTFTWTMTGTLAGDVTCAASVDATDGFTGLPVGAGPASSGSVHLARPAALVSRLTASPPVTCVTEPVTLSLTVTNTGETAALGVTPGPLGVTGPGSVVSGPTPAPPVILSGGAAVTFVWSAQGTSTGGITWSATVAGTDARTGGVVQPAAAVASSSVLAPGALVAALSAPAAASVGQWVTIALTVTHAGGTAVTGVSPVSLAWPAGLGAIVAGPSPGATTLASGSSRTFTWTFSVSGAGDVTFTSSGAGTTCTGRTSSPQAAATLTAVAPAALAAAVSLSSSVVIAGQWVTVTVTLTNTGGNGTQTVTPSLVAAGAAGTMTGGPVPASVPSLAPAAAASFVWTFSTSGAGTVTFTGGGTSADLLSGRTVAAPAALASVTVLAPARLVVTSFALSPASLATGDGYSLTLTVRNDGGVAASATSLTALVGSPAVLGGLTGPSPGLPVALGPGAATTFVWTGTAPACGSSGASASVSGVEPATGRPLGPVAAAASAVTVHGVPASLGLVASPNASPVLTTVALVATLRDVCGLAVPGASITFTVTIAGATVSPATAGTDSNGEARSTLTLGPEPGPYPVIAALASPALSATVVVTAGPSALMLATPGTALSTNAFSPAAGDSVLVRLLPLSGEPIRVKIYTASGRLVRTLTTTQPLGGGQVSITWDGRTEDERPVARGVYIILVAGGGLNARLKVVVR